jgi:hypothetical protein
MRFLCVFAGDGFPAKQIDAVRHGFKMGGIHAERDSAKMVKLQSLRNLATHQLKRHTMGHERLPSEPEPSITGGNNRAGPQPAARGLLDLAPERLYSLLEWMQPSISCSQLCAVLGA